MDARKQTAALAKDNSIGRLARAAAQEHQLEEDDLGDILKEKQLKFPGRCHQRINTDEPFQSSDEMRQFEAICAREDAKRGELQRLKVKNAKLNAAVEERKLVK